MAAVICKVHNPKKEVKQTKPILKTRVKKEKEDGKE